MKLTTGTVTAVLLGVLAAGCGPSSISVAAPPPVAPIRCDVYANPGAGTAQRLADSLRPGQTGCLRGGDYRGTGYDGYVLRIARGGRGRAPVRIASAPGERANLRGIVYVVDGADHVMLSNLDLDGRRPDDPSGSQVSIQLMANDITLEGSDVTNVGVRSCVIVGNRARHAVLRGNLFHECGDPANHMLDHAIYVESSRRARIVDNVFVRSGGWAVQLYPSARRSTVARNLMLDNGGGIVFGGDSQSASSGNVVEHNVIGGSHQRPELASSFGGPRGRRNVARRNCIAAGQRVSDPEIGFRMERNRIATAPECLGTVAPSLLAVFRSAAPRLFARLKA